MAVTSIVRDRGRTIGVVAVLTAAVALVSVPAALGAVDGDPIGTSTFTFKLSGKFKKQLKKNGVKMKPKKLKLTKGDVDPTTGAADLRFGKVTFKKGHKKVVYSNIKGSMPGKLKGSSGALFKLTSPTVARNGFGADLTGVKVKFLKSAAKKINKKLDLHSLKPATAGSFGLAYQPETVKILGGTAQVTGSLAAGSVVLKLLTAHCGNIPAPIPPATAALPNTFFPVGGGTISPAGTSGVVQQQGGVRITNSTSGGCASSPTASVVQSDFAVNLALQNIQAHVNIESARALCGGTADTCPPFTGDKGIAITQLADPAGATVTANPSNHTISVNGATIKINEVSAQTLNGAFPRVSANPADDFASGDVFGTSNLTVTVR